MSRKNEVLETYKGVPIRYSNVILLRTSPIEFKNIIDIVESTNLCISDIIRLSSKPCAKCVGLEITTMNKNDEEVKIPKGIFKETKVKWSGANLLNQNSKNKRQ